MRWLAIVVLVVSVVCASAVVNVMYDLQHMSHPDPALAGLMTGEVGPMFRDPSVWLRLPPALHRFLLDWRALFVSAGFVAASLWVVRVRFGRSWLATGAWVLVAGPVLYVVGRLALRGNIDPSRAGPWVVTMLTGFLYPLLACAALALVEIVTSASRRRRAARNGATNEPAAG